MKRTPSVGPPVSTIVVALSAGDARARANRWSAPFDLRTEAPFTGGVSTRF